MTVYDLMNIILVSDPGDRKIKSFNYSGDLLSQFEPQGPLDGLACTPAGICVQQNGDIMVSDVLNHTVSKTCSNTNTNANYGGALYSFSHGMIERLTLPSIYIE